MKKIEYMAPEMEVVEMKYNGVLCASGEEAGGGGTGFAPEMNEADE